MQPTVDTQLAAVRRSLGALADEHELTAEAGATLGDATKALERIERSWSEVLPFLVEDNAGLTELLCDLAPRLPDGVRADPGEAPEGLDVEAANARNEVLRELLARAIVAAGDDVRPEALAFLRDSVERRPW